MEKMKMALEFEVKIPQVPNFITVERVIGAKFRAEMKDTQIEESKYPVGDFTEDQLRLIGKEWTEKLVSHAKKQRENRA